jgi:hypothetical protein
MAELRARYLGRPAPDRTGPTVTELLADAYDAAR